MKHSRLSLLTLTLLAAGPAFLCAAEPGPEAAEFFEKKIRPVLVQSCYKCHSAEAKKLKGGLRLDSLAALLKGGDSGPSLVPGQPEKSKLIEAVCYKNIDLTMPPSSKLDDAVIADLTKWVKMGAPWPGSDAATTEKKESFDLAKRRSEHWAWKPIRPTPPPAVQNAKWARSPVDQFLLAQLEKARLSPAPEADRRTWLRRITFDLIGLPPTPQEVNDFVQDDRPGAHDRVVDRLLASPHFGEHWARHWLDLVRYGETRGHEFEPILPNAYQYRDYVIRAFNADVPYNQLVQEHIAGDLLPAPRLHPAEKFNESILGTGFWLLGEEVHSPVDIRLDQADRFDNRIDVMTKTFLGLTVSCARCHDHKFDAISSRDYYSLFSFLESSSYRLVRFDTVEQNRRIAQDMEALKDRSQKQYQTALGKRLQPTLSRLADYLLAASEGIRFGPETTPGKSSDVVFEDFEKGTYEGWTVTGAAFGDRPHTLETIAPYQGKINVVGKYFVNSHNARNGETVAAGDAHKGTMTSRAFTLDHAFLTMLVGGGAHAGKTCVNLLIDGKVVLTATGRNNNQMFPVRWDLRPFKGKTSRIQIVDNESGPWGNISVDQIVLTDRTDAGQDAGGARAEAFSPAFREHLEKLAQERKLDPAVLGQWVALVINAGKEPDYWLHPWARVALDKLGTEGKPIAAGLRPIMDRLKQRQAAADQAPNREVVVDYRRSQPADWMPDDASFGPGPRRAGELKLSGTADRPEVRLEERTAARYDRVWDDLTLSPGSQNEPGALGRQQVRAGRTLRTPTFTLDADRVHYLVRGKGLAYAAVSGHVMIEGPLHGELVLAIPAAPEFHWVTHELRRYKGLHMHVEFTAAPGSDFAVIMATQGPQPPAQVERLDPRFLQMLTDEAVTPQRLASAYQKMLESTPEKTSDLAGQHAHMINGLLDRPELLVAAPDAAKQMEETVREWWTERQKLATQIKRASRLALALRDGNGVDGNVFIRGSHKALGEVVQRRFLEALAGKEPLSAGDTSGRLQLAQQMTDPSVNPFISRVIVNRVWHHLFGQGIVPSVDNFGVLGERPTHPELLDYLADNFAREGWSIKKLIRSLALSSAYRMASESSSAPAEEVDPQNRLLHRMRVRRLPGEAIRDSLLLVSGRLDKTMGGPSTPIYLTPFLEGRGRPASGPLDGNGRRSIYLAITRNFLSPMMLAFDTPIPFSTVGRRTVSNVPAQALILLNDPFVHQQTELWGRRVAGQKATTAERIDGMYLAAFGRSATEAERKVCEAFLKQQAEVYKAGPENPAPWIDLAHTLVNVKEFIYLY
jgi:cytochrome c553